MNGLVEGNSSRCWATRRSKAQGRESIEVHAYQGRMYPKGRPGPRARGSALIAAAVVERRAVVSDCQFFGTLALGFAAAGGALLAVWLLV